MTPQEMWNAYKQINSSIGDEIDAWAFGVEADLLADLVLRGEKTATASAYDLYAVEDDSLPQEGTFDVILDSQDQAVCIVEITMVSVQPFYQVSAKRSASTPKAQASISSPIKGVDLLVGIPHFLRCHRLLLCIFLLSNSYSLSCPILEILVTLPSPSILRGRHFLR